MKKIKGYICCGVKNPFYNEMVELEVKNIWKDWKGNQKIEVKTVEKRIFHHEIIDIRTNKVIKEWDELESYEHFLDTNKPYEIIE